MMFCLPQPDEAMKAGSEQDDGLDRRCFNRSFGLRESVETLPCFDGKHIGLSRNQQFYIFVFEEIFRKYWFRDCHEAPYVTNRTPFTDRSFEKAAGNRTGGDSFGIFRE